MRAVLSSAYVRAGLVLVLVLALDQLTKHLVAHSIVPGEQVGVLPGIQLVHTRNHGVAFGLAAGNQLLVTILVGLALLAPARLLRHARLPPADLAADRPAPRRRPRQPARPHPHGLGRGLHPAAPRLAAVQPRRRLDRARGRAAAVRDRVPRDPHTASARARPPRWIIGPVRSTYQTPTAAVSGADSDRTQATGSRLTHPKR